MAGGGIYLHFPFCRSKCPYCDFYSVTVGSFDTARFYESLIREIELAAVSWKKTGIDTIFFGGGTPSLAEPAALAKVIDAINTNFEVDPAAEITFECNPESVDPSKLESYRKCGVNRLSIGVQSFCDEELKRLGRIHDAGQAEMALKAARQAGFANFSLDLIYGIPGQTFSSWTESLRRALSFDPPHLSAYCLTLEGGTPMQIQAAAGSLDIPSETMQAGFYDILLDTVEESPLRRYEISNFARPGNEARHNLKYWQGLPYLGLGPAAHSYDGIKRWGNVADIAEYCAAIESGRLPIAHSEEIDLALRLKERTMLGLRLAEGVPYAEIEPAIDVEQTNELIRRGLIVLTDDGRLKITRKGLFVCDEIVVKMIEPEGKP